jgi:hypothetical protein
VIGKIQQNSHFVACGFGPDRGSGIVIGVSDLVDVLGSLTLLELVVRKPDSRVGDSARRI